MLPGHTTATRKLPNICAVLQTDGAFSRDLEGWTEGAIRLESQSVCGSSPLLGGFKRVQGCWLLSFLQFTEPGCSWCHTSTEVIWFIWALMDWMLLRIFFWWPANVTPTLRMSLRRNNLSVPLQYTNKAITLILQILLFFWMLAVSSITTVDRLTSFLPLVLSLRLLTGCPNYVTDEGF